MKTQTNGFWTELRSFTCCMAWLVACLCCVPAGEAQVNSGSDGHDGAFNPTSDTVINMADHPDGIYHYTEVNIPTNVLVTFIPNANNTPVVWLVQHNVVVGGTVSVSGGYPTGIVPGQGGPGGGAGGYGGQGQAWLAHRGTGLGGGDAAQQAQGFGGGGSYATVGGSPNAAAGPAYGNKYLLPLLGGSGGGGGLGQGGGGGGGAIQVVSDTSIIVDGRVIAHGGVGGYYFLGSQSGTGGCGSGGGIRLVAPYLGGSGILDADSRYVGQLGDAGGGSGYVRLDALDDKFVGNLAGFASRGFNPILISPTTSVSLRVQSIGGVPVSASPTGQLATPDAVLAAQQASPIPIVVRCSNLPLNTPVTVSVKPMNGSTVNAVGYNNTGTLSNSTATVLVNMPRGGGLIYATAATGN